MTSKSAVAADILADYRELLRIVKNRPPGVLTNSEANKLIPYLEACIAEIEAAGALELPQGKELTG
jgi:uracil-DNA glycosylase